MTDNALPHYRPAGPSPLPSIALEEARERAIGLLTDGYAYDVISEAEFEHRLGFLIRAESAAELGVLVQDLAAPSALASATGAAHPSLGPDHARIRSVMSETQREGPWRVPRHLEIRAIMANVRLDLRYAAVPEGCRIEIRAIMANVTLILPPGLTVDLDIDPIMSNVRNASSNSQLPGYHPPRIHISGSAIMSEVRAKVRGLGR
jgi:hypothetical protein